jgi:hypothetical protein
MEWEKGPAGRLEGRNVAAELQALWQPGTAWEDLEDEEDSFGWASVSSMQCDAEK